MRKKYKIIRERFEEMLSEHTDYFRDEKGNPITGKVGVKEIERPLKMNSKQDLAHMLILTPQALSNNISGKFSPSMETLVRIGELYNINWKWLVYNDEDMTEADKFKRVIQETQTEADLLYSGVLAFLKLSGYDISPAYENDGTLEGKIKAITSGYVVSRDGKSLTLDLLQFNQFANKINDYVDFELRHMMDSIKSD